MNIKCKHESEREKKVKLALEGLLGKYDLSRIEYASSIAIDDNATSEDATLNTRYLNDPGQLLAHYIHMQCQVFVKWRKTQVDEAIEELGAAFPGHDKNYLTKLAIIAMEYHELRKVLGSTALTIFMNKDTTPELYAIIIDEADKINTVLKKYSLLR